MFQPGHPAVTAMSRVLMLYRSHRMVWKIAIPYQVLATYLLYSPNAECYSNLGLCPRRTEAQYFLYCYHISGSTISTWIICYQYYRPFSILKYRINRTIRVHLTPHTFLWLIPF